MKTFLLSALVLFVAFAHVNGQAKLVKNYQTYQIAEVAQEIDSPKPINEQHKAKLAGEGAAYINDYEQLNTGLNSYGYITWGTKEELIAEGIIQQNAEWSYDEVQNYGREEMEKFIQIETDSLSSINIPGALQYLLTLHDKNSYEVQNGDITELKILEKETFWANGNFLVVITQE